VRGNLSKIFVEDTEIKISEKVEVTDGEHEIKDNFYTMQSVVKTDFKSTIFSYEDMSVLISKAQRYNEDYYKIVLFNDAISKAWQLIILSARLDIKIKRLTDVNFIVIAESHDENVESQISFCKLKDSTGVEEITINFTTLKEINFIGDNSILICYEERDAASGKVTHVLSMYNNDGKMLKNFFEFADGDKEQYSYVMEDNKKLKIIKKSE